MRMMLKLPGKWVKHQAENFESHDPQERGILRLAEDYRGTCFAQLGNSNKALRHVSLDGCAIGQLKLFRALAFEV
jgi:hypothetical protein